MPVNLRMENVEGWSIWGPLVMFSLQSTYKSVRLNVLINIILF